MLWHLVTGEILATELAQFLFVYRHSFPGDDEGLRHLAANLVLHPDNRDFFHLGMLYQNFFYLAWIDVFSGRNNEILFSSRNRHESVRVDLSEIAGVQPFTGNGLRSL